LKLQEIKILATSNSTSIFLSRVRDAARWRTKRAWQAIRVGYLSWKSPEVNIAGVYIPLSKYISDNVKEAMFDGGYESAELRTIAENLAAEDRVLEIGTGVGLISTFCAKRIGSDRVFTFEANPELAPLIRSVYARNGVSPNLNICILGKGDGEETFYVHDDFWSSSLYQRSTKSRKVSVPRKDINQAMNKLHPTFLIMDIEGGESGIFDIINLDGITKIAVELHTNIIGQDRVDSICDQLADEGFRIDWRYSSSIKGFKEELFLSRAAI